MKSAFALLLLALPSVASASIPQNLAKKLIALIPEGYSEGVSSKGDPCRVVFSWMQDVDPKKVEYVHARLASETTGAFLDLELFFDGVEAKVSGSQADSRAVVNYKYLTLGAQKTAKNVRVFGVNHATREHADCLLPRTAHFPVKR